MGWARVRTGRDLVLFGGVKVHGILNGKFFFNGRRRGALFSSKKILQN